MRIKDIRTQQCPSWLARLRWVIASLISACAAVPAIAQDDALPAWLDVAVVRVAPGQGPAFEDLLKSFLQARAAAGLPVGSVYQVEAGHPNEYHVVYATASLAANEAAPAPMPEAVMALWVSRITATVDDVQFFYARTFPEHGIDGADNAAAPGLLLLQKVRVVAGREDEYESWVAEELMPAMRRTSIGGHTMSQGVFGDSTQNYYHAYPLPGWATLDAPNPLIEALGQRDYEELLDGLDGIVESTELIVASPRTDLLPQ